MVPFSQWSALFIIGYRGKYCLSICESAAYIHLKVPCGDFDLQQHRAYRAVYLLIGTLLFYLVKTKMGTSGDTLSHHSTDQEGRNARKKHLVGLLFISFISDESH